MPIGTLVLYPAVEQVNSNLQSIVQNLVLRNLDKIFLSLSDRDWWNARICVTRDRWVFHTTFKAKGEEIIGTSCLRWRL